MIVVDTQILRRRSNVRLRPSGASTRVGSDDATLGRGTVSGEPRAPNPAKHSRVQDASKRLDREQIRSREPGNWDHVYPPVQTVPARGSRQCRADEPMYRGVAGLAQRLAGQLVQQKERPHGSAG